MIELRKETVYPCKVVINRHCPWTPFPLLLGVDKSEGYVWTPVHVIAYGTKPVRKVKVKNHIVKRNNHRVCSERKGG